ncbi:Uncharacterised protein [Mycobacteroides abscessus]|nr:Uncharacterised protein [Mycobacteroides abscessus]
MIFVSTRESFATRRATASFADMPSSSVCVPGWILPAFGFSSNAFANAAELATTPASVSTAPMSRPVDPGSITTSTGSVPGPSKSFASSGFANPNRSEALLSRR